MGPCVAVNCGNNSFRKKKHEDVFFFCLPKDEKLEKKWLIKVRRENLPKEVRIYHLHFEESCFKRDLEVIHYSVYFVINYPLIRLSVKDLVFLIMKISL